MADSESSEFFDDDDVMDVDDGFAEEGGEAFEAVNEACWLVIDVCDDGECVREFGEFED